MLLLSDISFLCCISANHPKLKKYEKINGNPLLDTSGNIYTSVGKLDENGQDVWGGEAPIAFHDLRDDYIFGVHEVLGYLPEINYLCGSFIFL